MKARMRFIYQFHLRAKELSTETLKNYWLILAITALFNKKDPRYGVLRPG